MRSATSAGVFYSNDAASSTVTITNASPGVVSWTAHGLVADQVVVFTTSGSLPAGLTAGTPYFVISAGLTTNAFEVSATSGGSAINTSSAGSGTHTAHAGLFQRPFRIIGYVEYNSSGLATAGTYATPPNFVQLFGPGVRKPGDGFNKSIFSTSTSTSVTTTTKTATALTNSIAPTSAANLVRVAVVAIAQITASGTNGFIQIGRNSSANLVGTLCSIYTATANGHLQLNPEAYDVPNTTSSTTYTLYIWMQSNATGLNVPISSAQAGLAVPSYLIMEEIMG